MDSSPGTIGFVGVGTMGAPMAANLAKAGYRLVIYDIDAQRAAALAAAHEIEVAASLTEVGEKSGTVITMLPEGRHVREAVCGRNDGFRDCVAAGLRPGSVLIDMSSSSPIGTQQLGRLLAARGIALVDAPVSNGLKGAIAGTLSIMVGGEPALFERCRPIFEKLGNQIFHAGPLGAGHAIKALNNYVSAAGLVAACEAVIVGKRFGLDAGVVVDILNASSGMNNTTKNKLRQHMLSGTFGAGFVTGLMAKDVRTALELAESMGGPARMARHTAALWNDAERALGYASDHTAIYRLLDEEGAAPKR
jgi:3-hydroxyisobutyrate dehydrogenase